MKDPKQIAYLGAFFVIFGIGIKLIQARTGDTAFGWNPENWSLGERSVVIGVATLSVAAVTKLIRARNNRG